MKKHSIIFLFIFLILGCNSEKQQYVNVKVEYAGALKNFMRKGDISAKINLKDLENIEHLYALGAMENLKGEIQILNGKPYNSSVSDSSLLVDSSFNKKASLLVYSSVKEWRSFSIPENISSYKELENYIYETAKSNQINTKQPFPFLLEGIPRYVDWHVINWKDGDMEHTHEKHITSGLNGRLKKTTIKMLGFYSNSHHAIFTHHTTNMHIHMIAEEKQIAGHVDDLSLGKDMILKLPGI